MRRRNDPKRQSLRPNQGIASSIARCPLAKRRSTTSVTGKIVLSLSFAVIMSVAARVQIILPFTPVPITFQTFVALLAGMLLGPGLGMAAMLEYLCLGAIGLPVFAKGGGIAYFLSPTAGYLISFPVAAALTGKVVQMLGCEDVRTFGQAALAGLIVNYSIGCLWLSVIVRQGPLMTLILGVMPFIGLDVVKGAIAACLAASASRMAHNQWHDRPGS
ncbi:MAG: biotin transporter BioY [Armatimonadetes bacterium]|nr:biotin transporter BioY [Armatimonadota bacterium]